MQGVFFGQALNLLKKEGYDRGSKIFFTKKRSFLDVENFLREDGALGGGTWPQYSVSCRLLIKSPLRLAGTPWLVETFNALGGSLCTGFFQRWEGRDMELGEEIGFVLPFGPAILGERVALNLLRRASSIATATQKFVRMAAPKGIAILDTRKTTPGLRTLEKYAVRQGGGQNHRFHQGELWMVKDNHKSLFGGIREAVAFFEKCGSFYTPILVEIHTLDELEEALAIAAENKRVHHLMLDNFSPEQVAQALKLKNAPVTYEVSGGITLENIADYLLEGVDGISIGDITAFPPSVDMSLNISC